MKPIDARIYGRFSSKPQERGDSKRRQIDGAEAYAKKHGLKIVAAPYFDEGVSGKEGLNLEKEFGRLLKEAKSGEVILCEFLDRIGRQNPFILGGLLLETVRKGLTVIAWAEGKTIDEASMENMDTQFSVFTSSAVGYGENQRKIKRAKEVNSESYKQAVAGIPSRNIVKFLPTSYGWDDTAKKIIIHEDKAKTIRRIFDEYEKGFGKTLISQHLNQDNVPTVYANNKTKKWLETSIKKIISNEAYAGVATIKGHRITCFKGIVSKEQFDKVQMLSARWKTRFGKQGDKIRVNNLFRGIAVCEDCGGHLQVNCSMPHGRRKVATYSFRCRNAKLKICKTRKMVSSTNIEAIFFGEYFDGSGENLLVADDVKAKVKHDSLLERKEQLQNQISNLYDMAEQGDEEAKKRIELRKADIVKIEGELRDVKSSIVENGNLPTMVNAIEELMSTEEVYLNMDEAKEMIKNYYPNIRKKLSDNEYRRKLSVMLPSIVKNLVVNLGKNEFYTVKKDGKKLERLSVEGVIKELKDGNYPFK